MWPDFVTGQAAFFTADASTSFGVRDEIMSTELLPNGRVLLSLPSTSKFKAVSGVLPMIRSLEEAGYVSNVRIE